MLVVCRLCLSVVQPFRFWSSPHTHFWFKNQDNINDWLSFRLLQATPEKYQLQSLELRCFCWASYLWCCTGIGDMNKNWTACCGKWTSKKFKCMKMIRKIPGRNKQGWVVFQAIWFYHSPWARVLLSFLMFREFTKPLAIKISGSPGVINIWCRNKGINMRHILMTFLYGIAIVTF